MARRKRRNRRYPHIYFESKKPGKDAVYSAVKDIGSPGVHSAKEVGALAIAQFLDWLDGWTRDHSGRKVRFTNRKWAGRLRILRILASRYGGKRYVNFIQKLKKMVEAGKISKTEARRLALEYARKHKLPVTRYRLP